MPDVITDKSLWLVHEGLDDFRRLGSADLALNHPEVALNRADVVATVKA
jgi:hypothetical protein